MITKLLRIEYVMIALGLVLGYLNLCGCSVKLVKATPEVLNERH